MYLLSGLKARDTGVLWLVGGCLHVIDGQVVKRFVGWTLVGLVGFFVNIYIMLWFVTVTW